ncbi:MAG: RDD family protein [Salinivenus sp.]
MSDAIADAAGRGRDDPNFDPRHVVTPHAFKVDEALLNTPLAAPWQRLVALLVDLALAGIIANVAGGLVGLLVAFVFYRVATRTELESRWKRWGRGVLVALGTILLFGISIALVEEAGEWGSSGPSLTALVPGVQPDTAEEPASPDEGPPVDSLRLEVLEDADDLEDLRAERNGDAALPDTTRPEQGAELLRRYAQALVARDTAALDTLTAPVQSLVAGRRLDSLDAQILALAERNDDLADEAARLRTQFQNPSLWRMARATANDLGVTVGWVGLYFTLFLAWWGGRTPGKYLLGIRVVRLSGEPIGLWYAFERFGGYAAGIATGLLGFVQLYWDPNRQAIHDRVARTVVIKTRRS